MFPFLDETTHNLNQATQNIVGEILQFVYDKFQLHFSCIYRAPNLSKKTPLSRWATATFAQNQKKLILHTVGQRLAQRSRFSFFLFSLFSPDCPKKKNSGPESKRRCFDSTTRQKKMRRGPLAEPSPAGHKVQAHRTPLSSRPPFSRPARLALGLLLYCLLGSGSRSLPVMLRGEITWSLILLLD